MSGFWDKFRNRSQETAGATSVIWESFEADSLNSKSDVFVKGNHFDLYANDRLHADDLRHVPYSDHKFIDISPSSIEGIHLGKTEAEDPSVFWSQHAKGWGTFESFLQIASHIPEVRERLEAGESLSDVQDDPIIGECASIYFANMPKVYECDGYYEFDSNGRHRILAARELGHDIPVEVIGYYGRNEPPLSETPINDSKSSEKPGLDTASDRKKAVDQAWEMEKDRVQQGYGTRDWSVEQQAELLDYGKVTGFEGSHMMNVHDYPEYAGNPDNIQLLPSIAHFEGVHGGDPRKFNPSGRFDENTGEVVPSEEGQIPDQPVVELSDKYDPSQKEYHQSTPEMEQSGQQRHDDYYRSKENHPEKSQKIGFRDDNEETESESQFSTQGEDVQPKQECPHVPAESSQEQDYETLDPRNGMSQLFSPDHSSSVWTDVSRDEKPSNEQHKNQIHEEENAGEIKQEESGSLIQQQQRPTDAEQDNKESQASDQEKASNQSQDVPNVWSTVPQIDESSGNPGEEQGQSEKNGLSMS